MPVNTGGYAFDSTTGITVRDYFAIRLIALMEAWEPPAASDSVRNVRVDTAYAYADRMIVKRAITD